MRIGLYRLINDDLNWILDNHQSFYFFFHHDLYWFFDLYYLFLVDYGLNVNFRGYLYVLNDDFLNLFDHRPLYLHYLLNFNDFFHLNHLFHLYFHYFLNESINIHLLYHLYYLLNRNFDTSFNFNECLNWNHHRNRYLFHSLSMYFCRDLYNFILHQDSLYGFLDYFLDYDLEWSLYHSFDHHFNRFFHYPLYLYYLFDRHFNVDLCRSLHKFNDSFNLRLFDDDFRWDFDDLYSNLLFSFLKYEFWWILDVSYRLLQISHHTGLLFYRHFYYR